jgi:hypothetical protein
VKPQYNIRRSKVTMQAALVAARLAPTDKKVDKLPTIDRRLNDRPDEQFLKYAKELGAVRTKKLERK